MSNERTIVAMEDAIKEIRSLRAQLKQAERSVDVKDQRIDRLNRDIADLRAQLAEAERATQFHRERGDKATLDLANLALRSTDETMQLATSHAARLAAEARTAELRIALEKYAITTVEWADGVYDQHCNGCDRCLEHEGGHQSSCPVHLALATPDTGAGKVLVRVGEWLTARQNVNKGGDREQAESRMDTYVVAQYNLEEDAAAWRAARGERGEGG